MSASIPGPEPAGLTIAQAAVALGCSTDTVRRRVRRGEIPFRKDLQGRYRVLLGQDASATGSESLTAGLQPAGLPAHLEVLERERATLAAELAAWRHQAEESARAQAELRRLLAQAQSLIPRLEAGGGAREAGAPHRPWWRRRRASE